MRKLISKARATEVDGLSDALVRLYNEDEAAAGDAFVKSTMKEIKKLSAEITTAIMQDRTLSNLDAADTARDEAIKNLGAVLAGYAVFPVEEKRSSAIPLKAIYDKYAKAGIIKASYISESSMIESMLEDLGAADIKKSIAALEGVEALIGAVRSAEDAFKAASDAYVKASAKRGASASSIKKPLISAINNKLIPYLNAMELSGNAGLFEFIKNVEAEINRVNETIVRRGKKGADEAPEAGGEGETEAQAEGKGEAQQ